MEVDEVILRPRLLVVDDNRLDRELVREAVCELGRVECFGSGEECLRALAEGPADLVITDLNMQGISGLDLLAHVSRETPGTDVVLITAYASLDSALQAMRMGAADYLPKPVRAEELRMVVSRVLERRRLRAENDHLRTLLGTMDDCRSLAAAVEPAEIHGIALDVLLRRLARGRGAAVFRGNSNLGHDEVAVRGIEDNVTEQLRQKLANHKRPELESLLEADVVESGVLHQSLRDAGIQADRFLIVPMDAPNQEESGFLVLPEDGRRFGPQDLEVARMVAAYGQVGVYNAERYLRAKERAFVDDVTGAYNARYLFAALEHELRRAERYESHLTVIFLDIDRFKLVNDRHGHLVGSRTLRGLTQVLNQCIRQIDTLARYGGDEFTILLADTRHDTGRAVADRIHRAVAEAEFEAQPGETFQITVSVGVATYPGHAEAAEALLDAADKAMYRAKSLGRNRVCSASDL